MNQTFEQRIQSIEDQLKEIRKELEESLARYNKSKFPANSEKLYWRKGPCTISELYSKLRGLSGVEYVYIEDHLDLSVTITVVGGDDSEVADVLAESLMSVVKTIGDYQVQATGPMGWKFWIKRDVVE